MSNELAVRSNVTDQLDLGKIQVLGQAMAQSGFFADSRQEAQAVVKIVAGVELGIGPVAAMRGIRIVEGRVEYAAGLVASLIKRAGYRYKIVESSETRCEIEFFERPDSDAEWESLGSADFTIDEAKRAGLVKSRSAWESYPSDMLFNRALTRGARRYCPDVFQGAAYAEGEAIEHVDVEETVPQPVYVEPQSSEEEEANKPSEAADAGIADGEERTATQDQSEPSSEQTSVEEAATQTHNGPTASSDAGDPSSTDSTPPEPPADPRAEIPKLQEDLGWKGGTLLRFARELLGQHVKSARWKELTDDEAVKLAQALRAEIEKGAAA
jgi:hypothetical protein